MPKRANSDETYPGGRGSTMKPFVPLMERLLSIYTYTIHQPRTMQEPCLLCAVVG
jgi:hypothetical protein